MLSSVLVSLASHFQLATTIQHPHNQRTVGLRWISGDTESHTVAATEPNDGKSSLGQSPVARRCQFRDSVPSAEGLGTIS